MASILNFECILNLLDFFQFLVLRAEFGRFRKRTAETAKYKTNSFAHVKDMILCRLWWSESACTFYVSAVEFAGFYTCKPLINHSLRVFYLFIFWLFFVTLYKEKIIAGPLPPECMDQLLIPEKTTRNEVSHLYLPLKNIVIHKAPSSLFSGF